ncbi:Helix-turn-helix [Lachnospiraceae bacterium G41]|nr:Helix-turn-helix [Lachnospiraceae bacterium G41]
MDGKTTAKEIGTRIRKFRQLKGWSQKELGDKIGTSSAAISKYEKEGVHDIEVIQDLSKSLEVDLVQDEMDVEGEVGEIGLEILVLLLSEVDDSDLFADEEYHNGSMDAEELFDGEKLYGLDKQRIIHELGKLESCGLCVREQFLDFDNENKDIIFITAKGVIAIKRRIPDFEFPDEVKTYEMYCDNHSCVQEYIDSFEIHKEIEMIDISSAFRLNFFAYISRILREKDFSENRTYFNSYFSGVSSYTDILYSMLLEMNREDADRLAKGNFFECEESEELSKIQNPENDWIEYMELDKEHLRDEAEDLFINYLSYRFGKNYLIPASEEENESMRNRISKEEEVLRLEEIIAKKAEEHEKFFKKYDKRIDKLKAVKEKKDVRKEFTKDQIIKWINANILKPSNELEEIKQNMMEKYLRRYYMARDYFSFPREWENNGIADIVREAYGITEIMKEFEGETFDNNNDDMKKTFYYPNDFYPD